MGLRIQSSGGAVAEQSDATVSRMPFLREPFRERAMSPLEHALAVWAGRKRADPGPSAQEEADPSWEGHVSSASHGFSAAC